MSDFDELFSNTKKMEKKDTLFEEDIYDEKNKF